MQVFFDHVALLVHSVSKSAAVLSNLGYAVGALQEFPNEGTREIYVGDDYAWGRLLLIEAMSEGPYARALSKRGPGLHHIALNVSHLEKFIHGLSGSGWYLHPSSLKSIRDSKTAWLTRPGIPMLVEVFATNHSVQNSNDTLFVSSVEIPLSDHKPGLLAALCTAHIQPSGDSEVWLTIENTRSPLSEIIT